MPFFELLAPSRRLLLDRPKIMGIVNVTPDSFSDGGRYHQRDQALRHAIKLQQEGASLLDLGGESTRPGAQAVASQEEMDRVLPVLEALRQETDAWISIDTSNPELMREAAARGADLINDVRALSRPGALEAAAATGLPICLMHMKGEPGSMQQQASYQNLVAEVIAFLRSRIEACQAAGIAEERLLLDPGFGFAKNLDHNLTLLNQLEALHELGRPLLVGMSRKKMLGELTGRPVEEREVASVTAHLLAAQKGAQLLRVHDVAGLKDALSIWQALTEKE
ncbi:dihydropteroate synthase [Marinospirillum perlucidum]|uniref:dihydropteroate synthase n=1 Tax=Marinospirillum perlucidum TaxID=1982602 RepID=UPI00138FA1A6|nr:dihydropteroate synthase [Marinospirillum perlucidum]